MKNALWYLGFLSTISLLYFVERDVVLLVFLAFLSCFVVYNTDDERFEINLGRSTRNAFIYTIFFGFGTFVYTYLTNTTEFIYLLFTILITGNIFVCNISLLYYDQIERFLK